MVDYLNGGLHYRRVPRTPLGRAAGRDPEQRLLCDHCLGLQHLDAKCRVCGRFRGRLGLWLLLGRCANIGRDGCEDVSFRLAWPQTPDDIPLRRACHQRLWRWSILEELFRSGSVNEEQTSTVSAYDKQI